jgi:hypothetical protein
MVPNPKALTRATRSREYQLRSWDYEHRTLPLVATENGYKTIPL